MDAEKEVLKGHIMALVNALRPLAGARAAITDADQKRAAFLVATWEKAFTKWRQDARTDPGPG